MFLFFPFSFFHRARVLKTVVQKSAGHVRSSWDSLNLAWCVTALLSPTEAGAPTCLATFSDGYAMTVQLRCLQIHGQGVYQQMSIPPLRTPKRSMARTASYVSSARTKPCGRSLALMSNTFRGSGLRSPSASQPRDPHC